MVVAVEPRAGSDVGLVDEGAPGGRETGASSLLRQLNSGAAAGSRPPVQEK